METKTKITLSLIAMIICIVSCVTLIIIQEECSRPCPFVSESNCCYCGYTFGCNSDWGCNCQDCESVNVEVPNDWKPKESKLEWICG